MNSYNTQVKGKLTRLGKAYYLILSEGTEISAKLSKQFKEWLDSDKCDIDLKKEYFFEGQLKTLRYSPYLIMDKVTGISKATEETKFTFTARIFNVYKNCIEKYNTEYNFLLVSIGSKNDRFPMKLSFKELDNYELVSKTANFTCHREGVNIVIDQMELIN